jgi:hypothetical protein
MTEDKKPEEKKTPERLELLPEEIRKLRSFIKDLEKSSNWSMVNLIGKLLKYSGVKL